MAWAAGTSTPGLALFTQPLQRTAEDTFVSIQPGTLALRYKFMRLSVLCVNKNAGLPMNTQVFLRAVLHDLCKLCPDNQVATLSKCALSHMSQKWKDLSWQKLGKTPSKLKSLSWAQNAKIYGSKLPWNFDVFFFLTSSFVQCVGNSLYGLGEGWL